MVLLLLIGICVIHSDCVFLGNDEGVHAFNVEALRTFEVVFYHVYFEIMCQLSCIYVESSLVIFICNAVCHSWTKHHLATIHEIVHHVFEMGHQSFFVNYEEIDFFISGDLDALVALYEVDQASDIEFMVLNPKSRFLDFVILFFEK